MEKKKEVIIHQIAYYCDDCGEEVVAGEWMIATYPPKYPHVCPKCKKEYILNRHYPHLTYTQK